MSASESRARRSPTSPAFTPTSVVESPGVKEEPTSEEPTSEVESADESEEAHGMDISGMENTSLSGMDLPHFVWGVEIPDGTAAEIPDRDEVQVEPGGPATDVEIPDGAEAVPVEPLSSTTAAAQPFGSATAGPGAASGSAATGVPSCETPGPGAASDGAATGVPSCETTGPGVASDGAGTGVSSCDAPGPEPAPAPEPAPELPESVPPRPPPVSGSTPKAVAKAKSTGFTGAQWRAKSKFVPQTAEGKRLRKIMDDKNKREEKRRAR